MHTHSTQTHIRLLISFSCCTKTLIYENSISENIQPSVWPLISSRVDCRKQQLRRRHRVCAAKPNAICCLLPIDRPTNQPTDRPTVVFSFSLAQTCMATSNTLTHKLASKTTAYKTCSLSLFLYFSQHTFAHIENIH